MASVRIHTKRALAAVLPAIMLWVFLACAFECVAAADLACGASTSGDCCAPAAEDECQTETLVDSQDHDCLLVPDDPVVLSSGEPKPGKVSASSALPASASGGLRRGPHRYVLPRAAGPPARARPLDRLPVLLI